MQCGGGVELAPQPEASIAMRCIRRTLSLVIHFVCVIIAFPAAYIYEEPLTCKENRQHSIESHFSGLSHLVLEQ